MFQTKDIKLKKLLCDNFYVVERDACPCGLLISVGRVKFGRRWVAFNNAEETPVRGIMF